MMQPTGHLWVSLVESSCRSEAKPFQRVADLVIARTGLSANSSMGQPIFDGRGDWILLILPSRAWKSVFSDRHWRAPPVWVPCQPWRWMDEASYGFALELEYLHNRHYVSPDPISLHP